MHYVVRYTETPDDLTNESVTNRVQRRLLMYFDHGGWHTEELAEKAGIEDVNELVYMVRGTAIDLDILKKVCEAMGVSMMKILSDGVYEFRFIKEA